MQTLSVLSVEDGAIIAVSPTGERFRLPVDAAVLARLQSAGPAGPDAKRLSPREIQAHVRSGLSTEQVAALTGAPIAYIERFVGPVLAERSYIVESALAVRLPPETEGARSRTFGAVMSDRLASLAARNVAWSSAKEPSGWVLAVAFSADDVAHDARWRFDAKHMMLEPDNVEASTLSQHGVPAALTPRLRAIEPTAPVTVVPPSAPVPTPAPDTSRFDSAVFQLPDLTVRRDEAASRRAADAARAEAADLGRRRREPSKAAERDRPAERDGAADRPGPRQVGTTTDQLTALARRRDRRNEAAEEAMPVTSAMDVVAERQREASPQRPGAPRSGGVRRAPEATAPGDAFRRTQQPAADAAAETALLRPADLRRARERLRDEARTGRPPQAASDVPEQEPRTPQGRPRRGRTSMPSWDEIVFGRDE